MEERYYSAKEVMKILGVKCYNTLKRWEQRKLLIPIRSPLGTLRYSQKEIDRYLNTYCTYNDVDNDLLDSDSEDENLLD